MSDTGKFVENDGKIKQDFCRYFQQVLYDDIVVV